MTLLPSLSALNHRNCIAMKLRSLLFILFLLPAVSCGPLSFMMSVDMRQPSRSGLELGGKSFSVAYLDDGDPVDSAFIASVSEGFAQRLESEYFDGKPVIMIYNIDRQEGADYSSKDTVINVLMDTGSDVLFLFDAPELGEVTLSAPRKVETPAVRDSAYVVEASLPYSLRLYVYDSMNSDDRVLAYTGTATANPVAYTGGGEPESVLVEKALSAVASPAREAGAVAGGPFLPGWDEEDFTFIYYDSGQMAWVDAAVAAHDCRWQDAMDIWLELTDTGNLQRRSCAAYNIAVTFYILGRYDMAKEWLDISDADYPLHLSYDMRRKIEAKLRK